MQTNCPHSGFMDFVIPYSKVSCFGFTPNSLLILLITKSNRTMFSLFNYEICFDMLVYHAFISIAIKIHISYNSLIILFSSVFPYTQLRRTRIQPTSQNEILFFHTFHRQLYCPPPPKYRVHVLSFLLSCTLKIV